MAFTRSGGAGMQAMGRRAGITRTLGQQKCSFGIKFRNNAQSLG